MEIAFDTQRIRSFCESGGLATEEWGAEVAQALKHRLADLRAATSVKDLVVGQPRVLDGEADRKYMYLDLCNGYRMVFSANHPTPPMTDSGNLDWAKVSRVKISRIERIDD